jgi:hypothetical protein
VKLRNECPFRVAGVGGCPVVSPSQGALESPSSFPTSPTLSRLPTRIFLKLGSTEHHILADVSGSCNEGISSSEQVRAASSESKEVSFFDR